MRRLCSRKYFRGSRRISPRDTSRSPCSGERLAQVVSGPEFTQSGVHWSWGNRQKEGRATFAQPLSAKATDATRSATLWDLSEGLVGLSQAKPDPDVKQ
jgi:protochlorophyllide reductase